MPHVGNFPKPEYPRPLSIGPPAFVPGEDNYQWSISGGSLDNRAVLTAQTFLAPVFLPHGATVTKFKLYGRRTAAEASLVLYLQRAAPGGSAEVIAELAADWTDGSGSIETTDIAHATIDNDGYCYLVSLYINPDAIALDVRFHRAMIDWK